MLCIFIQQNLNVILHVCVIKQFSFHLHAERNSLYLVVCSSNIMKSRQLFISYSKLFLTCSSFLKFECFVMVLGSTVSLYIVIVLDFELVWYYIPIKFYLSVPLGLQTLFLFICLISASGLLFAGIPGCAKSALCRELLNAPGGLGDDRPINSLMGDLIKGISLSRRCFKLIRFEFEFSVSGIF